MNQMNILRRSDIDYAIKVKEALIHAEDAFRKKDIQVSS